MLQRAGNRRELFAADSDLLHVLLNLSQPFQMQTEHLGLLLWFGWDRPRLAWVHDVAKTNRR